MSPSLDLCYADPARSFTTAGEELDDLDRDLYVRRVSTFYQILEHQS